MIEAASIRRPKVMQVDRAPSEKKEEIPFIIKKANRNTKVSTAAITWLSVREEINTPMARFAHPRRKNPRIPVYAVPKDTVPNFDITRGYRQMIAMGIAKMVTRARYLPITIFPTETGAVRRSWSVFCFRSSARVLMVRIGTLIRNTKVRALSVYSNLG